MLKPPTKLIRVRIRIGGPVAEMKARFNHIANECDEQKQGKRCQCERREMKWFDDAMRCHTRKVAERPRISDPVPVKSDIEPRRNRGVRWIR